MRTGDVVAILSNGGFGGIYEKLPARLRALAGERCHQSIRRMRREDDDRLPIRGGRAARYLLRLALILAAAAGALICRNQLHNLSRQPRAASGGSANPAAGRTVAAGVAASGLECAVSGSRLRAIRKLGARERSRRTTARRTRIEQKPLADLWGREAARSSSIKSTSIPSAPSARNSLLIMPSSIWRRF